METCACGQPAVPSLAPFDTTPLCEPCRVIYQQHFAVYHERYEAAQIDYNRRHQARP